MNETLDALFLERDEINARIRDLDKQIARFGHGYFEKGALRESRKKETRLLESLDAVLPMLLALGGRMSEARALYPQAPFLLDRDTHDPGPVLGLRGYLGDRVDTLLKAVGPFPDVYFGLGRDGQMLIGLKPYGGNLFMFGQQLRYPDLFIYFGPEADVRDLAAMFRLDPFEFPSSPFPPPCETSSCGSRVRTTPTTTRGSSPSGSRGTCRKWCRIRCRTGSFGSTSPPNRS